MHLKYSSAKSAETLILKIVFVVAVVKCKCEIESDLEVDRGVTQLNSETFGIRIAESEYRNVPGSQHCADTQISRIKISA